jgi:hypothetical protein
VRRILSVRQRVTATFRQRDGRTLHVRKTTAAEPALPTRSEMAIARDGLSPRQAQVARLAFTAAGHCTRYTRREWISHAKVWVPARHHTHWGDCGPVMCVYLPKTNFHFRFTRHKTHHRGGV